MKQEWEGHAGELMLDAGGTDRSRAAYRLSTLGREHLEAAESLQHTVVQGLQDQTQLSPFSPDELERVITGRGRTVGVFVDGRLMAFRAVDFPGNDPDNLALDLGFAEPLARQAAHFEMSVVHPDCRGNGLQQLMGHAVLELIRARRDVRFILATVSPSNVPSLKDKFALGMHIAALKPKYGGLWRYILLRKLEQRLGTPGQESCIRRGEEETGIVLEDTDRLTACAVPATASDELLALSSSYARQQELLAAGFIGTRLQVTAAGHLIAYRKRDFV
ncbi:hypothetical protein [Paenibacillus sp. y28]|uniref:hypothetical protein n=1 Tax=Paenibacillus sp. y28 TaxID=3129110 RepID=UPI00301970D6